MRYSVHSIDQILRRFCPDKLNAVLHVIEVCGLCGWRHNFYVVGLHIFWYLYILYLSIYFYYIYIIKLYKLCLYILFMCSVVNNVSVMTGYLFSYMDITEIIKHGKKSRVPHSSCLWTCLQAEIDHFLLILVRRCTGCTKV